MPAAFVTTKENDDSITISVNTNGFRASTSIFLNHNLIKTIDDEFEDFYLGTNRGLKNNVISITTIVFKYPTDATKSEVTYLLTGAADVQPENPVTSTQPFVEDVPAVPHFMVYYFI